MASKVKLAFSKTPQKKETSSDSNDDPQVTFSDAKPTIQDETELEPSRCRKFLTIVMTLTVEPFLFLYMFAFMMHTTSTTNLTMDKACKNELNYSSFVCSNLSAHHHEKSEVEKLTNDYKLYGSLIRFVPGGLATIFMGPWSDKYGRKPPLILALVGALLEDILLVFNARYFDAPLSYILLSSLPSGIAGGFVCVISISYSLASETTTERMRTVKYALVELGFGLGMSLGILAGGQLYKYYSYQTVFLVSTVGHALAVPWVMFVLAETRGLNLQVGWMQKIRDLFSTKSVTEGFGACLKVRPNSGRCQIWMLMISMCAIVITYAALADIGFQYVFHLYDWDLTEYSNVSTVFSGLSILLGVFCVPIFIRVCKTTDPVLGIIGVTSMFTKNICTAFAAKPWIYYTANITGLFGGVAPLAMRSRISKLVDKDDLGKVFSFLSACESLVPVLGTVIITRLYNATLDVFPGAAYLVAAILLVPAIGTFIWLMRLKPGGSQLLENLPKDDGDLSADEKKNEKTCVSVNGHSSYSSINDP